MKRITKEQVVFFKNLLLGVVLSAPFELWIAGVHWKSVFILRLLAILMAIPVALFYAGIRNWVRRFFRYHQKLRFGMEFMSFFLVFSGAYLLKLLCVVILNTYLPNIFPLSLESVFIAAGLMVVGVFLASLLYRPALASYYKYKRKKKSLLKIPWVFLVEFFVCLFCDLFSISSDICEIVKFFNEMRKCFVFC